MYSNSSMHLFTMSPQNPRKFIKIETPKFMRKKYQRYLLSWFNIHVLHSLMAKLTYHYGTLYSPKKIKIRLR